MKKRIEFTSGLSLRTKSIAACFLVQAVMLSILIWNNLQVMENTLNEQFKLHLKENLQHYKTALINPLATMDLSELQNVVENLALQKMVSYMVIMDHYDETLASVGWPTGKKLPKADDILGPLNHKKKVLNLITPIKIATQELAHLHVGFDLDFYFAARQKMLNRGITIAGIEMVATFLVIGLIMFFITRKLDMLADATKKIADGDWTARVLADGNDELDQVASSFNQMAQAIEQHVEKLNEEKIKSKIYFDVAAVIMLAVNSDQQVTMINKKGCEALGYHEGEVVGKNWFDHFVPEKFRMEMKSAFDNLFREDLQSSEYFENPVLTKDGRERLIAWRNSHVTDDTGKIVSIIASGDDITEIRLAEEALRIAHEKLLHAEKLSAIGGLAASIAHEFNNPLQGVTGIIKGVARRTKLTAEDAELMSMAVHECYRMRDLIKSLQDFNRPSSGRIAPTDIHTTIEDLLLLSKKDHKSKGITVEKRFAENMPIVKAVRDQIKQVILNLLNNAAYACDKGGTITIETEMLERKVSIRIHDTGKGIKPEDMRRIFDPFFTTKPELKGTGLGLSVCYGIIKKHRGEIVVDSDPGKGTVFTIILPNEENGHVAQENPGS